MAMDSALASGVSESSAAIAKSCVRIALEKVFKRLSLLLCPVDNLESCWDAQVSGFIGSVQGRSRLICCGRVWRLWFSCDELRPLINRSNPRCHISDQNRQKACFERAIVLLQAGDASNASLVCDEGLAEFADDANILCLSARCLFALKRFDQAQARVQQALKLFPNFALAHEVYGDLFFVRGHYEMAIKKYHTAQRLDPRRTETRARLDKAEEAVAAVDKKQGAKRTKRKRMAFDQEMAEAARLDKNGEPEKAEDIYREILGRDPDHVEAARLLAAIAVKHNRFRDADVFLQRVVKNAPNYGRAWVDLSNVQHEQEKHEEAIYSAEQALRLAPKAAESHILMANAFGQAGRLDESIESYRNALSIAPGHPGALSGMAHRLKTIGKQEESIAAYRQCLAANPLHTESYWSLANLKTFRFKDEEVEAMETLLADKSVDDESRVYLHNALGLEYEGRKDYDKAFANFSTGNGIRRKAESYDPVDAQVINEALLEVFSKEFIEKNKGSGCLDASPIFVVGLPRSGSTLIEQILASHSQVEGTHELADLPRVVRAIPKRGKRNARFPESIVEFGSNAWTNLGDQYIERTRKFRSDRPVFIDKNPNNFVYAGLIKLILPNAKIINARRHPLDSCFGSYKQLFASGQSFTYDLMELGEYYLNYQKLMDHWHAVIPGHVLDVNYEDVVADLETQVRRILEYCQLPFEESCLRFHETDRAVKTASSEQVRRPIYSTSVNLWRNYENHLDLLIDTLEPLLMKLSAEDRPASLAGKQDSVAS